jgi:hypothetical protein
VGLASVALWVASLLCHWFWVLVVLVFEICCHHIAPFLNLEYDDSCYLKKKKKLARNIVLYLMHNYNNIACDSVISVPLSLSLCQEPIFMEKRGLKKGGQ